MTYEMQVDLTQPRDMVLTRLFDAPRELVWKCWTDPEHLATWWGPEGMTNRVSQDLRPGGTQQITMIDPDGNEYPLEIRLTEVIENTRLSGQIGADNHPSADIVADIVMTVTFEDTEDGKTLLTVRQTFATGQKRDANMELGAKQGWHESFEKLDRLLSKIVNPVS